LYGYLNEKIAEDVKFIKGIVQCVKDIELWEDIIESNSVVNHISDLQQNDNGINMGMTIMISQLLRVIQTRKRSMFTKKRIIIFL